jgi:hypothetical protein
VRAEEGEKSADKRLSTLGLPTWVTLFCEGHNVDPIQIIFLFKKKKQNNPGLYSSGEIRKRAKRHRG